MSDAIQNKGENDKTDISDFEDEMEVEEKGKGKETSEFARLFEASLKKPQKRLSVGDKVKGEILVIGKEEVYASTGTITDGLAYKKDMTGPDGKFDYKVGDWVDFYVTQIRGTEVFLSVKPTSKNLSDDLEDAYDMMLSVEGRVVELCKGGVRVMVQGKLAFCPISQLDTSRVETGEEFVGKKLEFKITQYSEGGKNVVVSRRRHLEEQRDLSQGAFSEERRTGEVVSGVVKKIEPFGAFVEVSPGVEGLLHVSEMSWSRVSDPNLVVQVGQQLQVKILKSESVEGRLKISLSLKLAEGDPWNSLPPEIEVGKWIQGTVTRCLKFGAFVEVAPGVEGLIPLSGMSDSKRVRRSDEVVKEGDRIKVLVKDVQPHSRRISLSLRDGGSESDSNREDWIGYSSQTKESTLGTLGGAFGDSLKKAFAKKKS